MLIFLGLSQRSMIYFPSTDSESSSLRKEAAIRGLNGWPDKSGEIIGFCNIAPRSARPRASIVIFHGNAGCAVQRADYVQLLRDAMPASALSVYILEYPGYGPRNGSPSQETLIAAAKEAVALIPSDEKLVLLGESLGSGVACAVASASNCRVHGLLLLTPFDSMVSVARHHYPLLPVGWILRDRYPSDEWLSRFGGPAVFVLASDDEVIPVELGTKLYNSYEGPKKLFMVQGATHNDLLSVMKPIEWSEALEFVLAD